MFDFPSSPGEGQVFTPPGGPTYTFRSPAWQVIPLPGKTARARNLVVNGAMQISQERGDASSGASAVNTYYPADQWLAAWSVTGAGISSVRVANVINLGLITGAALAAGAYCSLNQAIEGVRLADLAWGTPNAKPLVLRFDVSYNVAATFTFSIQNGVADRSYLVPLALNAGWNSVVLTIPGDTTGTWTTDTEKGMTLQWQIGGGSNYTGVAGWQAGNKNNLPGSTNGIVSGRTFALANVGLYLDPDGTGLAPPFEIPDYAEELRACQRYWESLANYSNMWSGNATTGVNYFAMGQWAVEKRANPTITGNPGSQSGFPATVGSYAGGLFSWREARAASATANGAFFYSSNVIGNARM